MKKFLKDGITYKAINTLERDQAWCAAFWKCLVQESLTFYLSFWGLKAWPLSSPLAIKVKSMNLTEAKNKLREIETELSGQHIVEFECFQTPFGDLTVSVTDRLQRICRKGKVWKSNPMLTALKNATYGYNPDSTRSRGGADGIFLLDRGHHPTNSMMVKIFAKFLDKPDPLVRTILTNYNLDTRDLLPVRLVSHHMRLLGVLFEKNSMKHLILVDFDNDKNG